MSEVPEFRLYGEGDPGLEEAIQPALALRPWSDLTGHEKEIALRELLNRGWLNDYSGECLITIEYLNRTYLRQCPGQRLHQIKPSHDRYDGNENERRRAAVADFKDIFLREPAEPLVLRMLSVFAKQYIDSSYYRSAAAGGDEETRKHQVDLAFEKFDRLANCINHIFEQFAVNQLVTRSGLVPRQDERITKELYVPTLVALSDPRWVSVSTDLAKAFDDYRHKNYPETITKAHSAVQRFLQILLGEEGKNAKGELGKLFKAAKDQGIIPVNRFTEPIIGAVLGFIPAERATNSTAKPAIKEAAPADALLMLNVVMVLLQYCLQNKR